MWKPFAGKITGDDEQAIHYEEEDTWWEPTNRGEVLNSLTNLHQGTLYLVDLEGKVHFSHSQVLPNPSSQDGRTSPSFGEQTPIFEQQPGFQF